MKCVTKQKKMYNYYSNEKIRQSTMQVPISKYKEYFAAQTFQSKYALCRLLLRGPKTLCFIV